MREANNFWLLFLRYHCKGVCEVLSDIKSQMSIATFQIKTS